MWTSLEMWRAPWFETNAFPNKISKEFRQMLKWYFEDFISQYVINM